MSIAKNWNFISLFKSSVLFSAIRKLKYRNKRKNLKKQEQLGLEGMRLILMNDLKIKEGDSIFVHCGFGFLNADFSPMELIALLQEVVGEGGNIMMPFYPPGLSNNWAKSGRVFDNTKVKCSTGILAQKFSIAETKMSTHPTKAVAVWGARAEVLIADHDKTTYPYDLTSPYYKFANLKNSKSIGLGVNNCAMIHCAEDIYEMDKSYLYTEKTVKLAVSSIGRETWVDTYIHHGKVALCTSNEYLSLHAPNVCDYKIVNSVPFYCVDNRELLEACQSLIESGVNRKCL